VFSSTVCGFPAALISMCEPPEFLVLEERESTGAIAMVIP
jgi:hypothetical protein